MKIKLNKEKILPSLQTANNLTSIKTGAAYLKIIWFRFTKNLMEIFATDSKIEYQSKIIIQYSGKNILFGCSGKYINELIKKLPQSEIILEYKTNNNYLTIHQEKRKYKLPTFDKSWFQEFTPLEEEKSTNLSGTLLRKCIEKIYFCIDDNTSDNMNYLSIAKNKQHEGNTIDFCGLNNHQFALVTINDEKFAALLQEHQLLIAKPYLNEVRKWLPEEDIKLCFTKKRIAIINSNNTEFFSIPLSISEFPDYNRFIGLFNNENVMTINRMDLIDSLERISLFTEDIEKCCYFVIEKDELFIYSQGQESGEGSESLSIEFNGDLNKICFPTKKLIEILIHFDSEKVQFNFTSSDGPCKVTNYPEDNYLVVLMPVKIEEEVFYTDEEI